MLLLTGSLIESLFFEFCSTFDKPSNPSLVRRETTSRFVARAASTQSVLDFDCSIEVASVALDELRIPEISSASAVDLRASS